MYFRTFMSLWTIWPQFEPVWRGRQNPAIPDSVVELTYQMSALTTELHNIWDTFSFGQLDTRKLRLFGGHNWFQWSHDPRIRLQKWPLKRISTLLPKIVQIAILLVPWSHVIEITCQNLRQNMIKFISNIH